MVVSRASGQFDTVIDTTLDVTHCPSPVFAFAKILWVPSVKEVESDTFE